MTTSTKKLSLADAWKGYRQEVLSAWTDEQVITAFRIAFYAGAHSLRVIQQEADEPLDTELEALEAFDASIRLSMKGGGPDDKIT
jgi:hypothetical protein